MKKKSRKPLAFVGALLDLVVDSLNKLFITMVIMVLAGASLGFAAAVIIFALTT